jgi:hypothetical protein
VYAISLVVKKTVIDERLLFVSPNIFEL